LSNFFTGVDIVDVDRIKSLTEKYQDRFLNKVFSLDEQNYCNSKYSSYIHYSGKFAAKEAVMKSLYSSGEKTLISFVSIAIKNNKNGVPEVFINGLRKDNIKISISHTNLQAIAFAILDNG
tara:strand:- start:223 stop:585 length:363 start_codon:yes stop_codon:yes gene_type:complete